MILTPEGKVMVADRASASRYDITVEKNEKARRQTLNPVFAINAGLEQPITS